MENSPTKIPERSELSLRPLSEATRKSVKWDKNTAPSELAFKKPKFREAVAIVRDVDAMPPDYPYSKSKWLQFVAKIHNTTVRRIRRLLKKRKKGGFAALHHTKQRNKLKVPKEAQDYAAGIKCKSEHRRFTIKEALKLYRIEARRQGWPDISYSYMTYLCRKILHPALKEYRDGGRLALDNLVTPIMRTYANLDPLQIIVADQHKMDVWVMDEETGEVFRPMIYMCQDLRTRLIVGLSIDKRSYNANMIGSALRLCVSCFGIFGNLYTDNGRPEISHYVKGILNSLNTFGISWKTVNKDFTKLLDSDDEGIETKTNIDHKEINAKLKNAKAKLIERLFGVIRIIWVSDLKLPGFTKRLGDDIHEQDKDHQEAQKLAKDGKLITYSEFIQYMFKACDIYNNRPHRGVLSEWAGKPKPREASPIDCLKACWKAGWRPNKISDELADLIFLEQGARVVNKGMVTLNKEFYTHDALILLHGQRVSLRFDPMSYAEVHVFKDSKFVCTALPIERSNMLDQDLISRKNAEKRKLCKSVIDEYKRLSSIVPDFRQYSKVLPSERVAALIGTNRKQRAIENLELNRTWTQAELDEGLREAEERNRKPVKIAKPIPERPNNFFDDSKHFDWLWAYLDAGGQLMDEDKIWLKKYEGEMRPEYLARWLFDQECMAERTQVAG